MDIGNIQNELNQMVVIITGGNKGIGAGIAKAFCVYGAQVIIAARDASVGQDFADNLTKTTSGTCSFFQCDVSDDIQTKNIIDKVVQRFGHIDCLINNAGFLPRRRPIDDISYDDLLNVMQVNLGGVFSMTKAALPYLRSSHGSIINISSVLGHTGQEGSAIYAASKAAITAFSKSIACDEARNGVRINVISPGDIRSNLNNNEVDNTAHRVPVNSSNHIHWINRQGTPEEIGTACLFLASSWASFMTGSELFVDGGFFAGHGYKQQTFDWSNIMQTKNM